VAARPRGGDWLEGDIAAWRRRGVTVVVSLLTLEEICDLGLEDEQRVCDSTGIEFFKFPIVDRSVPADRRAFSTFVTMLNSRLQQGKNVVIHCRQGIGRSGLLAITLLIQAGKHVDDAIQLLTNARSLPVPETLEQSTWIRAHRC
jgi:protein-tyrosine phosphatase